jgi:membrane protease YdiL (CAAX protease family)
MIDSSQAPWGLGATVGWGILVATAFIFFQGLVLAGFVAVDAAKNSDAFMNTMVKNLKVNGFILAMATFVSTPLCIALIALLARLRRGPSVKSYLGLTAIAPRTMLIWLGILTLFALISDLLTRVLGRTLIPDFMVDAYATAHSAPLFLLAIVVVAPLFEEVFFRGFLFEGFQHSKLGSLGAVFWTSFAWTIMHVQYGAYELGTIFALGIVFGIARLKSQSIYPPLAMHSLFNLFAMVQLAVYFR